MNIKILGSLLFIFVFISPNIVTGGKKKEVIPLPPPLPLPVRPANGSLFNSDGMYADLLVDFKPRRVGDVIFIDVIEGSDASVSSSAKNSKTSGSLGASFLGALPLPSDYAAAAGSIIGALGTQKFEGSGSTERKSQLNARIAGRIVEVFPNGDLRIEAEKSLKINRETEKLILSGIVRRHDIGSDNAVLSTSLANLKVELNGKGVASTANGPGWLIRFFQKISPF